MRKFCCYQSSAHFNETNILLRVEAHQNVPRISKEVVEMRLKTDGEGDKESIGIVIHDCLGLMGLRQMRHLFFQYLMHRVGENIPKHTMMILRETWNHNFQYQNVFHSRCHAASTLHFDDGNIIWAHFHLWLSKVGTNERRHYMYNGTSDWLGLFSSIARRSWSLQSTHTKCDWNI